MKYDYEKIIEALKIIKEVCEKSDCTNSKCPLYKVGIGNCYIKYGDPEEWEIKDVENLEVIKVFVR